MSEEHWGPGPVADATAESTRPQLHFTAREGWINDPLGLTFRDGRYHLFYQAMPAQTEWGPRQSWGHATSPDLRTWTEHPLALTPGDGDDGVWSGTIACPPGRQAALFYTAVSEPDHWTGRIRLARPDDESWTSWTKAEVIAEPPAGADEVVHFRDPYVFFDGTIWRMVVGGGVASGTATAWGYRSDDLEHWSYDGVLASRPGTESEPLWTGSVWECPQLFQVDGRWVLVVSVWQPFEPQYVAYAIGRLDAGRFEAQTWGRMSYGPSYYAASTFVDRAARPGLIYWMRGVADPDGRWASAHSVPHRLHLVGERLVAEPHPEVVTARNDVLVRDGGHAESKATAVDVLWDVAQPSGGTLVAVSDRGATAHLEADHERLILSTGASSWTMPRGRGPLRVLLDVGVVEVFADHGVLGAPLPGAAASWSIAAFGGAATVRTLA